MGTIACWLSPTACAATSLGRATIGDLFGALAAWVLGSVGWLLHALGALLNAPGSPSAVVADASGEFTTLSTVSPILLLLGLLVTTIRSVARADAAALWRTYLGAAPLAVLAIAAARPLARLVLSSVDAVASAAGRGLPTRIDGLSGTLSALAPTIPGFGLLVVSALLTLGAWILWCELIVRGVVLALLLVTVPLVAPLAVVPAVRRVAGRLVEAFLAVAAAKVLIVVTLAVGLRALTGGSLVAVSTGVVTIVLATFVPVSLLRVVPVLESAALHHAAELRGRAVAHAVGAPWSPWGRAVDAILPLPPEPGPYVPPEDFGLPETPGSGHRTMPPQDGPPPPWPILPAPPRRGHFVAKEDDIGPVIGWEDDD